MPIVPVIVQNVGNSKAWVKALSCRFYHSVLKSSVLACLALVYMGRGHTRSFGKDV